MSASRGASDAKLAHGDRKFIEEAAQGGLAEVQLGQLAAQKAESPEVKQFGQKMVDDHTKANTELQQLASKKGITLPQELSRKHKSSFDKLSKASGDKLDKDYMKDMVDDHEHDVKAFRKQAQEGTDPDMAALAKKTLPVLENHLQQAKSINAKVK